MAAAATNFVLLNDDELADLNNAADSLNTKKQISYAIRRLESFAVASGTSLAAVESLNSDDFDKFLSRFYAGLRTDTGDLYKKKSMHAIRYGLHRHFLARDVDITSSVFKESSKTYKSMLVKMKSQGKGFVKHKKAISNEDMALIFDSLDITTPEGLQNKVFIDIMVYFANRGRENLRGMSVSDFELETDGQGLRYITHRDTMTKSRRETEDEEFSGHMYEIPGSNRCPVSTFLAFKEVLNPDVECMWQRPKPVAPVDGSPWFVKSPLGVNTLGNKMKVIAEKAGCSHKYTNHSLRATTCTLLDEAGFPNRHIMSVTGHRSESSLKHYSRTSDKKKQLMSNALAHQMSENVPEVSEPTTSELTTHHSALLDSVPEHILTNSQEQLILGENFNIHNATSTSSVQQFHFHGPVTFYNQK